MVAIITAFLLKFIEAIKMETITFTSQVSVSLEPKMTTVSTYQTSTEFEPFMFALAFIPSFKCFNYTYQLNVTNFTMTNIQNSNTQ